MKRRYSDTDLASFVIQTTTTADTAGTDTMGRAYRTPSPAPEAYISSSNVNSPTMLPMFFPNTTTELGSYQQRRDIRALDLEEAERAQNKLRHLAHLSSMQNQFAAHGDYMRRQDALVREEDSAASETVVAEPKTPTKKLVQNLWHGLPSPETPTFYDSAPKTYLAPSLTLATDSTPGTSIKNGKYDARGPYKRRERETAESGGSQNGGLGEGDYLSTPQVPQDGTERGAMPAQELEAELSPSTTRRSNRLRAVLKPVYAPQLPVTAPKTLCNKPAPTGKYETPSQPELSIVSCKSDPIPFGGLPTVHSLSWQLQYPPGGSTHPSYPYPLMDPRLIFQQPFVPIIDGLPDFTRVPKLVLPMGWKHVSWAGLLPIAFDPYKQAFKLTPVGPMPLTCEELHQGGLHKYVPGGELHPEYGMLPEMLKLSDGSNAEVFDFDGVDWTLPWEGHMDFHASNAYVNDFQVTVDGYPTSSSTSATTTTIIAYPWKEERDCPNLIVDLSDAWRWLAGKEVNPTVDFIPTPMKIWKGTGAARTTYKYKTPIAELMMLAQLPGPNDPSDVPTTNPILRNQDANSRTEKNAFCPFRSVATPVYVDITLLGDTEFTLVELLSYFPQHFNWGHAAERMTKAGLGPAVIKALINMTRLLGSETAYTAQRVAHGVGSAKKRDLPKPEEVDIDEIDKDTPTPVLKSEVVDVTTTYTAEGWAYDVWEKIDYPLLALAHGLQSLPSGPDAGPLSALILWCRKEGRYQVLLSEVPAMLREAGIEPLIEPGEAGCPDKEVVARHADAMKKDKLRVLRSLGEKKRALGAQDDAKTKSKRRKAE